MRRARVIVAAVVAVELFAVVGVSVAVASTLSTVSSWDGSTNVHHFGTGATATYGQTITGTGDAISQFTFYIQMDQATTVQGGVALWNGGAVTSTLWQGDQQTIPATSSGTLTTVTFSVPAGVMLASGQKYVIYATVDSVPNVNSGTSGVWGAINDPSTYTGGGYVYHNGPVVGTWDGLETSGYASGYDLAFSAVLGLGLVPVGTHLGYCSVEGNTNPVTGKAYTPGTFLDLVAGQSLSDASYTGATPANYVEGMGITCDAPPAGYVRAGLAGSQGAVASGGFYPYWTKP